MTFQMKPTKQFIHVVLLVNLCFLNDLQNQI